MTEWVDVCIPNTKRDAFTYQPSDQIPVIGARVWVPFRNTTRLGVVVSSQKETQLAVNSLKPITEIIDTIPLISQPIMELCLWVSQYYQSPLSEVLSLALPKHYREGKFPVLPKVTTYSLLTDAAAARSLIPKQAVKQHQLLTFLEEKKGAASQEELRTAGFNTSHLKPLLHKQLIQHASQPATHDGLSGHKIVESPLQLNDEQAFAVTQITQHIDDNQRFLLYGVTGSGKTEVYLQAIAPLLAQQRQILILVPEIGLTPQLVARFKARFTEELVVIHSNLTELERQLAWHQASSGKAGIVIGTRTAVFTPLPRLGLIIIDEEHDASLKQQEGVRYSARDTALMRAHKAKIPIVLGSATPSLESLHNCWQQKYTLLPLTRQAMTAIPLQWTITDLRGVKLQDGLAPSTVNHIERHLQQGNQVLVFINRRGFSPILLCHQCSWIADCTACDSHLTFHRQDNRLVCHHCGGNQRLPQTCRKCQSHELVPVGTGTQRLEDYLQKQFPTVALLRIDRDEVRKKDELSKRLVQIHQGNTQLIIGTQMMAKGHHFPRLTLVVVVDADCGIYNQDFRAIEHLGQLITQVAGRAGRAEHPGEVIIQTHFPAHPQLNTLIQNGYTPFAKELLQSRSEAQLPPHAFLAIIRAQSSNAKKVSHFLRSIKAHLDQAPQYPTRIQSFGPAPAPLARKANQYRMQLLLKSSARQPLQHALTQLRDWIQRAKTDNGIRWHIDVDPIDLS